MPINLYLCLMKRNYKYYKREFNNKLIFLRICIPKENTYEILETKIVDNSFSEEDFLFFPFSLMEEISENLFQELVCNYHLGFPTYHSEPVAVSH